MQSVSDDDVWKRLLEKPHLELAAKGVFTLGRCCIFWQGVPGFRVSNRESTAIDGGARKRQNNRVVGLQTLRKKGSTSC